jgi:malignant T-cell-amplified sequence
VHFLFFPSSVSLLLRYSQEEFVSSQSQCKSSIARAIRARLIQDYPSIEDIMEDILPKKQAMILAKAQNHMQLLLSPTGEVLFFQQRDSAWFPTLRLIHQYPDLCATWQVDKGAIKHVLGGANVFCGGLVSDGGRMDVDLKPGQPVVLMAEGKVHACAVGMVKMTPDDARANQKGVAVDTLHYLNDGLWIEPKVA